MNIYNQIGREDGLQDAIDNGDLVIVLKNHLVYAHAWSEDPEFVYYDIYDTHDISDFMGELGGGLMGPLDDGIETINHLLEFIEAGNNIKTDGAKIYHDGILGEAVWEVINMTTPQRNAMRDLMEALQ